VRGRKGIIEVMTVEKFVEMYTSGMTFSEIAEQIGATEVCVKDFFLEHFLGFERFKLKKERLKKLNGGDIE
jgi:hypothetical protein